MSTAKAKQSKRKATTRKKAAPKTKRPSRTASPRKKAGKKKAVAKKKTPIKKKAVAKKTKTVKKAPPAKKPVTSKKAVAVKQAAPAAKKARSRKKPSAAAKRAADRRAGGAVPEGPKTRLGFKWACFGCELKFYDLNRPEPICPRCGTDQRERPRPETPPKPAPVAKKAKVSRTMAPLLDDEEDATVDHEAIDLGIGPVDDDSDDYPAQEDADPVADDA